MDPILASGASTSLDWYWKADDGRLFSSARVAIVPVDDADYRGWLKARYLDIHPLQADGTPQTDASLEADPAFQAWMASGGYTSPWPRDDGGVQTVAALQAALDGFGLHASLDALKTSLKVAVDDRAEALRLKLITPGSGQAMEYQEAYAEAVQVDTAVTANPSATFDPANFPMLAASLGYDLDPKTGKPTTDIAGEARSVLAAYDAYQKAGAAIRGARLKGKAAIDAAADAATANAASAAIVWPAFI